MAELTEEFDMYQPTDVGKREPHDEKTPGEVIALNIREQGLDDGGFSPHSWRCEHADRYPGYCTCVNDMRDAILDALVYKAYFEEAESALRWLDPEGDVQRRVLNAGRSE